MNRECKLETLASPALSRIGVAALRYGLALLLVLIGSYKFFVFEAEGIRPLVGSSPLLAWLYGVLSLRSAAAVFGLFEISVGPALVAALIERYAA